MADISNKSLLFLCKCNSVFEKGGARVIIDTITLPMISGSRIDFIEELIGSAFKVLANPHAAHSCGCDTSFEIKI